DKIGLISSGRPEWLITDLAVQLTGAILVPLYPNTTAKEVEQILIEAEVKYMFVSNRELYDKAASVMPNVPSLKKIYTYDQIEGLESWETLLKPVGPVRVDEIKAAANNITADNVTTIIYTSGTTGRPKGVMLTHHNIVSNALTSGDLLMLVSFKERRALSFLPLNHIFEKMTSYLYLFFGFSIYYAESMDTIGADIRDVKPSMFSSVPRLLEKIFEKIMMTGQQLTGFKRKIFIWSIKIGEKYELENKSLWYKVQLALAGKLVFSKWRAAVGGNVKAVVVGSSATPIRLEKIFTAAGIPIFEGYGLTETSPVISVNHLGANGRRFGTVGRLIQDVQVEIAADGEILCKGPN
ncbi:MAG: AMP-dependent synthetase/ligase, partial [Candidatus Saccharimonadales bacterium]